MRKFSLVVAIVLVPFFGLAQSMFDKYENMDKVGTVVVNKGMINLVSKIGSMTDDPEAQDFAEVAKGIKGIKVFITEDKSVSADMTSTVKKYLRKSSMEELMRVKDKDVNVKFYIKEGKDEDHVRELLMFVSGMKNMDIDVHGRKFETVLVSMTGNIDLNKIGAITNKMNLPKELNNAGKK
ncbi:DUF4252 domain-containing protein [uncultured Maribacter sp.]|uniref:DUF4252 domain-containing protein n=1 Tax=uncultured Maribacter sp. TaxID=431308 RepID=UPI002636E8AF|nr:DUF4252 domain-containing protein [uncultured Maribacter sp.]